MLRSPIISCWSTDIRGSLPGAGFLLSSATLLILPSRAAYHPVSSYPIQTPSTTGHFKRLTSAWISNMKTASGVDRVDNNRWWSQKWDQWAPHKPRVWEHLLQAWPMPGCTFAKAALEATGWLQVLKAAKKLGQAEDSEHLEQRGLVFPFHKNMLEKMSTSNALLGSHNCKRNPSFGICLGCM